MKKSKTLVPPSLAEAKSLMGTALGDEKADLAVVNGTLLNVYTGELLPDYSVSIKGKWIAYVGDHPQHTIGPDTMIIDAGGKTVIPGFIDGHAHLAFFYSPETFLKHAVTGGTTTIITETMEVFYAMGNEGVAALMEALSDQPIKILGTVPAMVSTSRNMHGMPLESLQHLMDRPDMVGLGELYWQAICQTPDVMIPLLCETRHRGKTLEGHSAGAKGKKLAAYLTTGISSCHEPITPAEVLERLRLGVHVMIREGSIRRDLEVLSHIREKAIDFRRLAIVTDGVDPRDLLEKGYMEYIVQKAVNCGFDPIRAVQMATVNVAEHFRLDGLIGGIAPGKLADMVIIPEPGIISAEYVISNGRVIAQNGEGCVAPRHHVFSKGCRNTIRLPENLNSADFRVAVLDGSAEKSVRVIAQVTELVTQEIRMTLSVEDGEIRADPERDIAKVAAVDRYRRPGERFVGFITGLGIQSGALASSAAWDTSNIILVGVDDADMALAINRIRDLQGGAVVCSRGHILAELPLPIFGIMSQAPLEILAQKLQDIKNASAALGIRVSDPLLTLNTLTGAAIPYLRICEEGLVNIRDGKGVGLFIE